MKKILGAVLVLFMLVGVAGADQVEVSGTPWLTMWIDNTSLTAYQDRAVPTDSIYPGTDRILGYSIRAYDPANGSEVVVGLYDSDTSLFSAATELIHETEASSAIEGTTVWFPYPRHINTQLRVRQGMNTTVVIYFER